MKKTSKLKYQTGGSKSKSDTTRKADTVYGKVVTKVSFSGNKGKPQGAPKKKFMDGGTAGVANSYNPVKGYKVNKGVGKSTMATTPAPAYKKGGVKKYNNGGGTNPEIPKERSGVYEYRKISGTKSPKPVKVKFKKGGSTKKK